MAQPMDVQRKLRQLDHDVQSIYELLAGIAATQERHSNRFMELGETVDEHTRTLHQHGRTLDEHTRTLDEHTRTLDEHTHKLDTIIALLGGDAS
jgi:flagellar biosynthesis chaperone FliJ